MRRPDSATMIPDAVRWQMLASDREAMLERIYQLLAHSTRVESSIALDLLKTWRAQKWTMEK